MVECSICLVQDISEAEKCTNNCGHNYCKPCLDGWFNTGKYTCPLCILPIQYFKYNDENFRIIKPINNNINITNDNNNLERIALQYINKKKKYSILLMIFTIISGFFVQCYFIHSLYNDNKHLKQMYNEDTSNYINIIRENNFIDINNMINIKIFYPNKLNCSIPFYYFDKCI